MKLLDCHTHIRIRDGRKAIVSVGYSEWTHCDLDSDAPCSVGFHPWYLPEVSSLSLLVQGMETLISDHRSKVWAIGECGLDKRYNRDNLPEQIVWLESQIDLACRLDLPLVLHVVSAWSELIALRQAALRRHHELPPMVIHGFRGNREVAAMMLQHGFLLSFGQHFRVEALSLAFDKGAMLVETDMQSEEGDLVDNYRQISESLSEPISSVLNVVARTPFWRKISTKYSLS